MENPDDFTLFLSQLPRKEYSYLLVWQSLLGFGGMDFFFLSLKSVLHHLLPRFGLGLFRDIRNYKTPPPHHIRRTERNLKGKKKFYI